LFALFEIIKRGMGNPDRVGVEGHTTILPAWSRLAR
jgi:hypothetical protein